MKPEINGGAPAPVHTYPSRVVLGALELLLEPVEVRLRLLQRRLRLLLLQLVLSGRRLKRKMKERWSVFNAESLDGRANGSIFGALLLLPNSFRIQWREDEWGRESAG